MVLMFSTTNLKASQLNRNGEMKNIMKKLLTRKNLTFLGIIGALLFAAAVSVPQASANTGEFNIDVAHLINGKDLDLDKELPVNVYINNAFLVWPAPGAPGQKLTNNHSMSPIFSGYSPWAPCISP